MRIAPAPPARGLEFERPRVWLLLALWARTGSVLRLIEVSQYREDAAHLWVAGRIVDVLRVAACGDEVIRAQLCQMLRKRRLAEADLMCQLPNGHLLFGDQAEDTETLLVGQRAQELRLIVERGRLHF